MSVRCSLLGTHKTPTVVAVLLCFGPVEGALPAPPCFARLEVPVQGTLGNEVVGVSVDGCTCAGNTGGSTAWRWERGDVTVPTSFYASRMSARDLSPDGRSLVGRCSDSSSVFTGKPVRWTSGVGIVPLTGHDFEADAQAVAADGLTIAGYLSYIAARWDPLGGFQTLGVLPGGDLSYTEDISHDGQVIVGYTEFNGNNDNRAFRWTESSGLVNLGVPDGYQASIASAVSANGDVVVGLLENSQGMEAFRWTADDGIVPLGHLPGGSFSQALDVSSDGSIVVGIVGPWPDEEGMIWDAQNGMRRVRNLLEENYGWDVGPIGRVTAVTPDGQTLVGNGEVGSGSRPWIARLWEHDGWCPGDIDGDRVIDSTDLAILLAGYGLTKEVDFDCDCDTDLEDLTFLLSRFGTACP